MTEGTAGREPAETRWLPLIDGMRPGPATTLFRPDHWIRTQMRDLDRGDVVLLHSADTRPVVLCSLLLRFDAPIEKASMLVTARYVATGELACATMDPSDYVDLQLGLWYRDPEAIGAPLERRASRAAQARCGQTPVVVPLWARGPR